MPLCYGGGITTPEQIDRIIGLGVEKVAIGASAVSQPELVAKAARHVGSQSIVAVIDVRRTGLMRRHEVVTHNATQRTGLEPVAFAQAMEAQGAGEILLNSVDRDGTLQGYDLELVERVRQAVKVPMTVLGGAGSLDDVGALMRAHHIIGAAAGSLFVFKGKYRAVLINYPNRSEKEALLRTSGWPE